jgi:hypothetical protein
MKMTGFSAHFRLKMPTPRLAASVCIFARRQTSPGFGLKAFLQASLIMLPSLPGFCLGFARISSHLAPRLVLIL